MGDAQAVQVGNGQDHLCSVQPRQVLIKDALPVQLEEQVAAIHKVQHQVQLGRRLHSTTLPNQLLLVHGGDDQQSSNHTQKNVQIPTGIRARCRSCEQAGTPGRSSAE